MAYFEPPIYAMIEFDDSALAPSGARRWLHAFNGRTDESADDVCLGWRSGVGPVVLVSTGWDWTQPERSRSVRREAAMHLVLGGSTIPLPGRPADPEQTHALRGRLIAANEGWTAASVDLDGHEHRGEAAEVADRVSVGYFQLDQTVVAFAVAGLDASAARFRSLTINGAAAYDLNPCIPQTAPALDGHAPTL